MTADQLNALEARTLKAQLVVAGLAPSAPDVAARASDVLALVAEVRRLQGLLKHAEYSGGYHCGGYCCPWCECDPQHDRGAHFVSCSAFNNDGSVK